MKAIRAEKNKLRKQWYKACPNEIEGLTILYNEAKKKCRNMQRNIRRNERRKESRRTHERILKNPYAVAKKLFAEGKSGC